MGVPPEKILRPKDLPPRIQAIRVFVKPGCRQLPAAFCKKREEKLPWFVSFKKLKEQAARRTESLLRYHPSLLKIAFYLSLSGRRFWRHRPASD
jgi:hypothetical protein